MILSNLQYHQLCGRIRPLTAWTPLHSSSTATLSIILFPAIPLPHVTTRLSCGSIWSAERFKKLLLFKKGRIFSPLCNGVQICRLLRIGFPRSSVPNQLPQVSVQ